MARKKKEDNYELSNYQLAIIDFIRNGNGNLVVEASAGSGKTYTLMKCVEEIPGDKSILLSAFNRDIANVLKRKAKDMFNVNVSTLHSLGLQMLQRNFPDESLILDEFKYKSYLNTNIKTLSSINTYSLNKREFARYMSNIEAFINFGRCYLCETVKDLEFIEDRYDITPIADEKEVALDILEYGKHNLSQIDYTDMIWLPNVLFCKPLGMQYDWIILDEAQDLSVCQREIVLKCRKINTRMLFFGDSEQCQPTGTKVMLPDGSEKNIEDLKIGDYIVTYNPEYGKYVGYKNYSVKGNITYQACKKVLGIEMHKEKELLCVKTKSGKISKYTPNHICYSRLNGKYCESAYAVYIMMNEKGMYRIGKTKLRRNNNTFSLNHRMKSEGCIKAWIIDIYNTEKEARISEIVNSCKFGIPQIIFDYERASNHGKHNKPYFSNEEIEKIYSEIGENIEDRVKKCLNFYGKKIEYPFIEKGSKNYISSDHFVEIRACNLFPKFMEVNILDEKNIKTVKAYSKKRNDSKAYLRTPDEIESIEHEFGEFDVWSLDVEDYHNYVADGILTHNCLYSFASSDPESFKRLKELPNTKSLPLSISYRCAKNIVEFAKKIVPTIEANNDSREGEVKYDVGLDEIEDGDMVLCRNNAPLMQVYVDFIKQGKKCFIRGKDIGLNLKNMVKRTGIEALNKNLQEDGVFVRLYDAVFDMINELVCKYNISYSDAVESASVSNRLDMIKALEILSDDINTSTELIDKISNIFSDRKKGGISLSTIHKAKGLEANNVYIACRHLMPSSKAKKDWEIRQEYNLMYVAYTRAKDILGFIDDKEFESFNAKTSETVGRLKKIENQVNYVLKKEKRKFEVNNVFIANDIIRHATKIEKPKAEYKIIPMEKKENESGIGFNDIFKRRYIKKLK